MNLTEHFHMPGGIWPLLVVLLLVAAAAAVLGTRRPWLKRIRPKPIMTDNEASFLACLERALPSQRVFPQVSFAAFLTDDGKLDQKKRWEVRARFDRKIADFVVCDRQSMQIVAIVELDDRTHNSRADRLRDELTEAAGYKTLRFASKQKPNEAEIAQAFAQLIALNPAKGPDKAVRAAAR